MQLYFTDCNVNSWTGKEEARTHPVSYEQTEFLNAMAEAVAHIFEAQAWMPNIYILTLAVHVDFLHHRCQERYIELWRLEDVERCHLEP